MAFGGAYRGAIVDQYGFVRYWRDQLSEKREKNLLRRHPNWKKKNILLRD